MAESVPKSQIDAAMAYQEFFVPALFQEWAPRVLAAARVQPGHRVLDVACGTGVLAREAAAYVGAAGSVAGLDPQPGMLAVAERLMPGVQWRRGVAESLPYPEGSFDAVVSQFGLMFFTDRPRAVREMLRVLAPGGRLAVAVLDSLESAPAYAAEVELLERIGGRAAADALRAPFALGDRDALAALFTDAGAPAVSVATVRGKANFPSIRSMVEADIRAWMPVVGVVLSEDRISRILQEAEEDLRAYVTPEGRVCFDLSAHIVTAGKS